MKITSLNRWSVLLIPFSWLYGLVIWIKNFLYDNGFLYAADVNIPTISVGNITVGGTGKTPHVEYLLDLLKDHYQVATLSRGYKRKTRDFRIASHDSGVREIGDEPKQIKRKFPEIIVAVDRKRVHGIERLLEYDPPVEVILLDDAFQHRSLRPGFSILLIDYARPLDRDRLLPAGRLREPAVNRSRADIILVTRSPESLKPIEMRNYVNELGLSIGQHLYFTSIRYGELIPVFSGVPQRSADWFKERVGSVLIVAGIANPRPIREFALNISTRVTELTYRDHHYYSSRDLDRISRKYHELTSGGTEVLILTTEKDAARLIEHHPDQAVRDAFYAVGIHIHFLHEDKEEFDQHIRNYVNSNKRDSILYQGQD